MTGAITVKTSVSFRRWTAPNYAVVDMGPSRRVEGLREGTSVAVADLAPEALDALAEAWLADLYEKAKRPSPFIRSPQ